MGKRPILNASEAYSKLERMVLELAENLSGNQAPIILIGVRNSGTVIAQKAAELLKKYVPNTISVSSVLLDKNLPKEVVLADALDLNDVNIVLIDDVINSGRTLLYALKPLLDFMPRTIQTFVLVERMHKLFPVKPDYVGLSVATTPEDHIKVETTNGNITGAVVV
ncbi:MAG: phosphoribosyltransferase [Sediminibacterium sp.]|nr:phosphoribosyltransferase [Sediminibacterium sp.]MBX9778883.1 phosphoribosyltransferase [Chitinophagaceae bacterium]